MTSDLTLTSALIGGDPRRARALGSLLQPVPHSLPQNATNGALQLEALRGWINASLVTHLPSGIRRSVAKRQLAFIAGRLCAEHALSRLGVESGVPSGVEGEPLWPAGTAGSITHTDATAFSAVIRCSGNPWGIGIDSESCVSESTLRDILATCCVAEERATLFDGRDDRLTATIVFCVKEAFYKAIHSRVRRIIEFGEVQVVSIDRKQRRADVRPTPSGGLAQEVPWATARFLVENNIVHACVSEFA